ncbi:hypothetical protein [Rhizobium rhizogenes]|uniref:hypothetical protein n=1 Tax=Rhizobium rhizogenes TaxID=359 RepID=UPI00157348B9|nr:hypothetical protein [Rhizobium rhizogenes]NTF43893.1 hypothetical protein [Rhizobium rhizogenes]
MAIHSFSRVSRDLAVEQSLDAAMEVQEVIEGARTDSPALQSLVGSLIGSNSGHVPSKKDLLSDARFTSLYHRAASMEGREYASASELDEILELLFAVNSAGLHNFSSSNLLFVRDFCLGLNRELVGEAFGRTPEPAMARGRKQKLAFAHAG